MRRRPFLQAVGGTFLAYLLNGCRRESRGLRAPLPLAPVASLTEGLNVFERERVVVQRQGNQALVLTLVCSHQQCILKTSSDGFLCPCHGARFDPDGRVLQGPATRNLDYFAASTALVGKEPWLFVHFGERLQDRRPVALS